jgi:pyruvate kinase
MRLTHFGDNEEMTREAVEAAKHAGHIRAGDIVVVLAGVHGRSRTPDVLRVITVT